MKLSREVRTLFVSFESFLADQKGMIQFCFQRCDKHGRQHPLSQSAVRWHTECPAVITILTVWLITYQHFTKSYADSVTFIPALSSLSDWKLRLAWHQKEGGSENSNGKGEIIQQPFESSTYHLAASKSSALKPHWLLEIAPITSTVYLQVLMWGRRVQRVSWQRLNMRNLTNLMMILLRPFCESNKTIWTGISGFEFKTASRSNACDGLRLGQTTVASCSGRSFFSEFTNLTFWSFLKRFPNSKPSFEYHKPRYSQRLAD